MGGSGGAAGGRLAVREALVAAARAAHADSRPPEARWFGAPVELRAEERILFEHAARWYTTIFAGRAVRTVLHDCDRPTWLPRRRVRLGGSVDLPLEGDDGTRELRQIRLGGRVPQDPLEEPRVWLAVLRLARTLWTGGELRVSLADLLDGKLSERTVDLAAVLPELGHRLDVTLGDLDALDPDAVHPGSACLTCRFVSGCPAHRHGANASGVRGDPRPGMLALHPTALERFERCARAWFLHDVLRLPPSDTQGFGEHGLRLHAILRFVHEHGRCDDQRHVADVLALHGGDDDRLRTEVEAHARRCPRGVHAVGHELEVARFHRGPHPLFMAAARLDAVWLHGGVLDVRDYKTGRPHVERVGDDRRARLQAWLSAPLAAAHGARVRVRYEHLAPEVTDDPEPFEPDDEDLARIEAELVEIVAAMRVPGDPDGVADPAVCGWCAHRSLCRDSAAPAAPGWAAPPDPETAGPG